MSRQLTIPILLIAAVLLASPPGAEAQVPLISQISPQPTSAGTPTSTIAITGSNFGDPTDQVRFPGNPVQWVSPTAWAPGYLSVPVPSTWSGNISVFSGSPSPDEPFLVSYNWGGEKWFNLPLDWSLNQNGAPGVDVAQTAFALNVAYDVWECASGFDHNYLGLTAMDGSNHNDGHNVQYWGTTPWANPGLIAVATWSYWTATGEIFEADIHYNGADWNWSIGGSATTLDIQNIATHESGHTLGLLDLYGAADNQKTMFGNSGNGVTFARTLEPADVQGAEYLYPRAGMGNLTSTTPSGWWGPIVPRDANDATSNWAPLPSTLWGYQETYLNYAETNNGQDCLSPVAQNNYYVDDQYAGANAWAGRTSIGEVYAETNRLVTVPGGRHTLRVDLDAFGEVVESNETDNTYRAQFAWNPYGLADQHPEVRPAPPVRGTLPAANCEGFMFTGNWWGAVAAVPTNADDDYDLYLFNDYIGSTAGYQTAEVQSVKGGDATDFVLVNGNIVGHGETRWAGTVRASAGVGADVVVQQSNQVGETYNPGTLYGSSATTGTRLLTPNQIIKVHEFYLADTSVTYEFVLRNLSGGADLDVAVFDAQVDYHSSSHDAVAGGAAGLEGEDESALYLPPAAGYYGVVVYKYDSSDLPLDCSYELICRVAPPNLDATVTPVGFDFPLVPRNTTGATPSSAQLTATLDGNTPDTYVNFGIRQAGPNDSPQWQTLVFLDDAAVLEAPWSGEPVPPTSLAWINYGGHEVRGGRHTLTLSADADDLVAESNEGDNVWREQYVWSPLELDREVPVLRDPPPGAGLFVHPNCEGMTFTREVASAWVVGITPLSGTDDYDVFLYEDYVDSRDGFDDFHAYSVALQGETDYVVGHYAGTPVEVVAGVLDYSLGDQEPYAMDANDARVRQNGAAAEYGFQFMDAFRSVDVYEVYLDGGQRVLFQLEKVSGAADLKLRLFPATPGGIYGSWQATEVSTTFVEGKEWLLFEADGPGWYPLVVSRTDYRRIDQPIEYNLVWGPTAITGVEEEVVEKPAKLMFAPPAPNPSSNGTSLGFALPRDGRVRIDIFDLRGHRVQTVTDRTYPAGSHQVRWTGRDEGGRQAATGVYYARLRFDEEVKTRRLTLIR